MRTSQRAGLIAFERINCCLPRLQVARAASNRRVPCMLSRRSSAWFDAGIVARLCAASRAAIRVAGRRRPGAASPAGVGRGREAAWVRPSAHLNSWKSASFSLSFCRSRSSPSIRRTSRRRRRRHPHRHRRTLRARAPRPLEVCRRCAGREAPAAVIPPAGAPAVTDTPAKEFAWRPIRCRRCSPPGARCSRTGA